MIPNIKYTFLSPPDECYECGVKIEENKAFCHLKKDDTVISICSVDCFISHKANWKTLPLINAFY